MKVEQGQPQGFIPIIITLETQEEANLMWAALNANKDDIYKRSYGHIERGIYPMWEAFNDIYPTGW